MIQSDPLAAKAFRIAAYVAIFGLLVASPAQAQWFMGSADYYPVGAYPCTVIAADFNGDGKLDLGVANAGADPASGVKADGSISILLGNGGGTFAPKVGYPAGMNSTSLVAADFNRDGKLDLAVSNFGSNSISIFLGKGDGMFVPTSEISIGQTPAILCAGDFNRDGKQDLVVTNFMDNAIALLLGQGDGTFRSGMEYPAGVGPVGMAVADFNGDGILDVATSCRGDDTRGIQPEIDLIFGMMGGGFDTQNRKIIEVGPDPLWLVASDLNSDGQMDLALSTGNGVTILLNREGGTFLPIQNFPLSSPTRPATGLVAGDWDGDGNLDLAAASAAPPTLLTESSMTKLILMVRISFPSRLQPKMLFTA